MKVLFLNSVKKQCGVYQYGLRVYDILKHSKDINYIYAEIEDPDQYMSLLRNNLDTIAIIFNYHGATLPWLTPNLLVSCLLNISIAHESDYSMFDINLSIIPSDLETNNLVPIPRPIFENIDDILKNHIITNENIKNFIDYKEDNVPIFGSFGFGFTNKGFDRIISLINEKYDKAIIKFVIPIASYDPNPYTIHIMREICEKNMIKPGIKLMINNDFFSTNDLLYFLTSNTMNIFLYDYLEGRGISSVIDYALSVKKPLGISDSYMFRHILNDDMNLYKSSLEHVMNNSEKQCKYFLGLYSHDNLRNKIQTTIINNIKKYSQASQDLFALKMLKYKKDGFFVDIGANHPFICNNTAILSQHFNWKGLLVEYDRQFEEHYKTRNNICYIINDASIINYEDVFKQINAPNIIDYLSIDLEVENRSTLNTLENMYFSIFNNYKFGVVTFEHDSYRGNFYDTKEKSRKIFNDKGYVLLFRDVRVFFEGEYRVFEDWYVHPDIIDNEYISKLITTESLTCEEIIKRVNNVTKIPENKLSCLQNLNKKLKGIFYNSKSSKCSIHSSGLAIYNILKDSSDYILDYSEEQTIYLHYDFIIYNEHFTVNNWISEDLVKIFNKPIYCIVTEIGFTQDIIPRTPKYFTKYIVLDPTIKETNKLYAFPRPILNQITPPKISFSIPIIGMFGYATYGKLWTTLIQMVNNEFNEAIIRINIPYATYVNDSEVEKVKNDIEFISSKIKSSIKVILTHNYMSETDLIKWCSDNTINCFLYMRSNILSSGLAAVTDQAIAAGRPILVTNDMTFRHIHKYINYFPNINITQAINETLDGVNKMRNDWSPQMFRNKFNSIL